MKKAIEPTRLDVYLVEKGYADSREKAKHLIKSGNVKMDGRVVLKPSKQVGKDADIEISEGFKYVGRGGYKIEGAVRHFGIGFKDKVVADIGCSTGGFTDYSLKHGAKKVYAVDIGDVMDTSLKENSDVVYMPNTDARTVKSFDEALDLCLIDVTFSTIESILTVAKEWLKKGGEVLGLIKPPFEGKEKIRKVSDYEKCARIAMKIGEWASNNGYVTKGLVGSELRGKSSGQQEFFIYLIKK